jgi:protein translocase SEC61 complex gamma subunit
MQSVFRLSKKSDRAEFLLYLKLVSIGVLIIGTIGFLIKFISAAFPAIFG